MIQKTIEISGLAGASLAAANCRAIGAILHRGMFVKTHGMPRDGEHENSYPPVN